MQQPHLQKFQSDSGIVERVGDIEHYGWSYKLQELRHIGRSNVADQNQVIEEPKTTTCTASCNFHVAQFVSCIPQSGDGSSHVCVGGALRVSEQDVRQWFVMVSHHGNDIFWQRAFLDLLVTLSRLLLLPWLLLTVIICTSTFQKADFGWHWYLVSVLAHSQICDMMMASTQRRTQQHCETTHNTLHSATAHMTRTKRHRSLHTDNRWAVERLHMTDCFIRYASSTCGVCKVALLISGKVRKISRVLSY